MRALSPDGETMLGGRDKIGQAGFLIGSFLINKNKYLYCVLMGRKHAFSLGRWGWLPL
jgi:hypothetical protein